MAFFPHRPQARLKVLGTRLASSLLESQTKISSISQDKALHVLSAVNYFLRTCFVDKIDKDFHDPISSLRQARSHVHILHCCTTIHYIPNIPKEIRVKLQSKIMLYSFYFSARFQYQLNEKKKNIQKNNNIFKTKQSGGYRNLGLENYTRLSVAVMC